MGEYSWYGNKTEWAYAVTFLYKSLLQEERSKVTFLIIVYKLLMPFREEYLVCDFPCLLSSIGGYVGLFFGMSIFDLILTSEWMMSYFRSRGKEEMK